MAPTSMNARGSFLPDLQLRTAQRRCTCTCASFPIIWRGPYRPYEGRYEVTSARQTRVVKSQCAKMDLISIHWHSN